MKRKMKRKKKPIEMKRKKKVVEMKRKPKPPPEPKKVLYPNIMIRKDGKPSCFVCHKPLHDLRDLRDMKGTDEEYSDYYQKLLSKVSGSITMLSGMGRNYPLYRHVICEPNSPNWNKNPYLVKVTKKLQKQDKGL